MKDGIINPSSTAPFGFSAELFDGWLWKIGNDIMISFIECRLPCQGHFRRLIENILSHGFNVKIPTPLGRMKRIVQRNGYEKTNVFDKDFGEMIEVWVKRPPAES